MCAHRLPMVRTSFFLVGSKLMSFACCSFLQQSSMDTQNESMKYSKSLTKEARKREMHKITAENQVLSNVQDVYGVRREDTVAPFSKNSFDRFVARHVFAYELAFTLLPCFKVFFDFCFLLFSFTDLCFNSFGFSDLFFFFFFFWTCRTFCAESSTPSRPTTTWRGSRTPGGTRATWRTCASCRWWLGLCRRKAKCSARRRARGPAAARPSNKSSTNEAKVLSPLRVWAQC